MLMRTRNIYVFFRKSILEFKTHLLLLPIEKTVGKTPGKKTVMLLLTRLV